MKRSLKKGLPGGPNEKVFSKEGYRSTSPDVNNLFNFIPSGNITMKEKDGTPLKKGPLLGIDNLGNSKLMLPGANYQFPGDVVKEVPLAKKGGLPKAQKGIATFKDSLDLYKNSLVQQDFYNKMQSFYNPVITNAWKSPFEEVKLAEAATLLYKPSNRGNQDKWTATDKSNFETTKKIIKANKDPNVAYITDMITGKLDPNAPALRYDARIKPQGKRGYKPWEHKFTAIDTKINDKNFNNRKSGEPWISNYDGTGENGTRDEWIKWGKKNGFSQKDIISFLYKRKKANAANHLKGQVTEIPYYDPIAIKPGTLLTDDEIKKRVKLYGTTGIPIDRLKKLGLNNSQHLKPTKPKPVKSPCSNPITTVINNVPEKIPFGKKLVGTDEEIITVAGKKCEYVKTINPIYEDIKIEPIELQKFPVKIDNGPLPPLQMHDYTLPDPIEAPEYILDPYTADRLSLDVKLPQNKIAALFDRGVIDSKGHIALGKRDKTRLIPRIVQKATGYDPAYFEGYEDEEGNFVPGELDYGNATGSEMEFKGAASLRDLINQKKYEKEYEEYEKKLDEWLKEYEQQNKKQEEGGEFKKGGSKKKPSKKYSRSLMAKNRLFAKNPLFKKTKSAKNKIYDPYSPYFQEGGEQEAMNAMMKARLAYANEFNNPSAQRMINIPDQPYEFDNGDTGTHYMASMDNYAVPQIQSVNGVLQIGDYGPESTEAMRFDSDEDANYFAENYKDVSPGFMDVELDDNEIEEYRKGGYIVEDISVPSLTKASYGHSVGNLIRKDDGGSISGTQGLTDDFSQRLAQMILDARAQGVDLGVGSGYRSYEKQKRLWEQALKKYGSPEKARKWVAPPGGSFHNKGLAVDLNSNGQFLGKDANSKATEWAHANAKKYGLHFRMGHEPWHIEPIEKSKSSSDKENEHDHEGEGDFGGQKITTEDEYNKMVEAKNLEFDLKQKELEERERRLHDDDYSNWTPSKKEDVVNPEQQILDEYSKIIAPSNQNMNALYNANLQRQMKTGGFIVELDDSEIERYKQGGYIIEELPKAQEGIQIETPVWSHINTNAPVMRTSFSDPVLEVTQRKVVQPEVKPQPVVNVNKEKTFEEAHAEARSTLGPNAIFEFNGRKYGTNNPGEDFKPDEKTLEKSGLNTENVKQNIKKQNEEIDDPYISKKTVKVQEKEYEDWDKIKEKNIELNKSSNANKIVKYKTGDKSGKNYVIVDKKKGLLHIYSPGNDKPIFTSPVDLGANKGDAQTTTKVKDTNGDGIIDSIEAQKGKADFSLGNKMTGAGKYYISNIDPKGYGGLPLFNMMNESQYSNYKKTGKVDNVATSFHKGYISDDESRVSNGCVRCNKTTLDNLTKYLQNSSEIFILPEDEGNSFVYENGQLNFKVKNKGDLYTYKNNGKVYKKENNTWYVAPKAGSSFTKITEGSRIKELNKNATNAGYNYYVDSHGKVQKGQGVNKGPTLNYIPIKTSLDEEKFRDEKFTFWDFDDEQELKRVKEFTKSLQDNKQKIMKVAKINGDVYNDIAKITFGIFGTESNYADTHTKELNFLRAVKKYIKPSSSSSPDYRSKYFIYGADEDYRSVGPTQMRWSYLSDDEKKALKEVGINSNSELMYTSNAALATAVVLGIRYNQQLTAEQKKDIWKSLPKTWNTRANYAYRVKNNSKYLILEQKNTKDPKLIAKSNPKDVYTYKGNPNAKYKKDKNGNWYINYGSKTNNKFVRLNDPTGKRSKLLNANATKLKKFTR